MKNLSRVMAVLFFLFFTLSAQAGHSPLLIVEVQIAGEKASDDFIKIYNPTTSDIYLGNYQGSYIRLVKRTKTSSKDYTIKSWSRDAEAKIPAGGFYLWVNKDYTALSDVDASTSQTIAPDNGIALRMGPENTGEILEAVGWGDFNNVLFEGKPFPENPVSNQKLERKKINGAYQDTSNNANDFYLYPLSTSTPPKIETQPEPQPQIFEEPKPITYPSGIIINEILPSPTGPDEKNEWIEIFNQNSFEVDLSGWQISDIEGTTQTYTLPKGTIIGAEGFLVLTRTTTKIILNNDGDSLNLTQPDKKIIDSVNYEKAEQDQSYNRVGSKWFWSTTLTPGSVNIISTSETEKAEAVEEKIDINTASLEELIKIVHVGKTRAQELISLRPFYSLDDLIKIKGIDDKALEDIKKQNLAWVDPKLKPPENEKTESLDKGLAAVAEPFKQEDLAREIPKFLSLFLIALSTAIFSGIIILILKRKLKKLYNKNI